jgi:hypothetical protein
MLIGGLFWFLALLCCGQAVCFGGRDGRWAAFLIVAASILTVVAAKIDRSWAEIEMARFAVDVFLLAGLYALMLTSRRYWPIWMVGFHLLAVVTHLSTLLVPDFTPRIYRAIQSFWAIPVLLSLLIGVARDRRALWRSRTAASDAGVGPAHET